MLKRTKDLGKTFATIHEDIYSFGYIGAFLFFSVMEDPVSSGASTRPPVVAGRRSLNTYYSGVSFCRQRSPRVMYFSSDQGDTFSQALLPSASTEQVRH